MNHAPSYVSMVETRGRATRRLDPDTVTSARSFDAACSAAGGFLGSPSTPGSQGESTTALPSSGRPGTTRNRTGRWVFAFSTTAPLVPNTLRRKHGFDRIMIVDYDLHHGNGTQHSFYDDPTVLYVSTHQYPYYPGTGWYDEVGEKEGTGYTVNIPMTYGMTDADYAHVFTEIIVPLGLAFKPQMVLVSAGFDIHRDDPLGGMKVTERGFAQITGLLADMAEKTCEGRLACALEGGYNTTALAASVEAVLVKLEGGSSVSGDKESEHPTRVAANIASKVKQTIRTYWKNF